MMLTSVYESVAIGTPATVYVVSCCADASLILVSVWIKPNTATPASEKIAAFDMVRLLHDSLFDPNYLICRMVLLLRPVLAKCIRNRLPTGSGGRIKSSPRFCIITPKVNDIDWICTEYFLF